MPGMLYDPARSVMSYAMGPGAVADGQDRTQLRIADAQNANRLRLGQIQAQTELGTAAMQAEASKYPSQLRQQRFDTVFPWMAGQAGALSQQLNTGAAGGGAGGGGPPVTAAPVYTPEQTQAQVNAMRAGNQQQAQSQAQAAGRSLAGKGFASASPLLRALEAQYQGQAQQASTRGENDLRYSAAQGNATQLLKGQQAQESQYASRQQEANQRQGIAAQQFSALLAALGGLGG